METTKNYYWKVCDVEPAIYELWQRANAHIKGFRLNIRDYIEENIQLNEFGNKVPSLPTIDRAIIYGHCPNPALEWAINEYLKSIKFK